VPEGGRVACLMDLPIMTIAYAGTIKLSKEEGENGRKSSRASFLYFVVKKK